jgi:glycerol-3-phosphate dehydrogenase (NAD(P)+)
MLAAMSGANPVRCAVLGAGSFGTCLAVLLAEKGYQVELWARDGRLAETINRRRRNPRYLSEVRLPENIHATDRLEEALPGREVVLSVVPSHSVRAVWREALPHLSPDALIVSATKGIEVGTGLCMSQVLGETLPAERRERIVVLSGPSFAHELAGRQPTSVCVACEVENFAIAAQTILSSQAFGFRCYSTPDVRGVELGGALKNVIAIAVGCADGMGLGQNTRAALIARGLAEIRRLGDRMGANPVTFLGLSGVGDLILTCTGDLSRNRRVGVEIGKGRSVSRTLAGLREVAEGVITAKSAYEIAQKYGVDMPITEEVYRVLHEGKDPRLAIRDLMTRQLRSELE